jgi:hypothetical protein
MTQYIVTWQIDIDADTIEDAANKALQIQRKRPSRATFFTVVEKTDIIIMKHLKWNVDLGWC